MHCDHGRPIHMGDPYMKSHRMLKRIPRILRHSSYLLAIIRKPSVRQSGLQHTIRCHRSHGAHFACKRHFARNSITLNGEYRDKMHRTGGTGAFISVQKILAKREKMHLCGAYGKCAKYRDKSAL